MTEEIKKTEEEIKHKECADKIQALLDEYGYNLGVAGVVLIPK